MSSLYTLAQLQEAVYARLDNNTLFFGASEVTTIINEAIRTTNIFTGFYQGTVNLISVAGQLVYAVPAGVLYPQRVQFEGVQLDPIPITRIGESYRTWTLMTSNVFGQVARWVPIGINYFCLNPIDSNGGGNIALTGVLEPPLLASATDTMVLEDEYVSLVVEYAASRLPLKCGGKAATDASLLYQKGFQAGVKKLLNLQKFKMPKYWVQSGSPTTEGRIQ